MKHEEVIQHFKEGKAGRGCNVYSTEDVVYSYGTHFVLVTRLSYTSDNIKYLINGTKRSVSTSAHQNLANSILDGESIQIPFRAMAGLGIVRGDSDQYAGEKIRPIEVKESKWEEKFNDEGERYYVHHLGASLFSDVPEEKYYLSTFDDTGIGTNGLYCLIQLASPVDNIADAFESLKPPEVKQAEADGILVHRQGEWFFVKTDKTVNDIKPTHKWYNLQSDADRWNSRNTGWHTIKDVHVDGDTILAAGTVRHNYKHTYRSPEHKLLKLGDTYHAVYKNTEEVSATITGGVD